MCVLRSLSYVQFFVTLWTVAHQAPLSVEFSSQECWSGLPYPAPRDLPKPGTEPASVVFPELAGGFFTTSTTGKHFLAYQNKFFFHKYTHSYLQTSGMLKCLHAHEPVTHSFLFLNLQDIGQAVFSFYNILNILSLRKSFLVSSCPTGSLPWLGLGALLSTSIPLWGSMFP